MIINLIARIKILVEIDKSEEELITRLFIPVKIKKGAYFLKANEASNKVGFIVKGLFRFYTQIGEIEKNYAFVKENDFVGEYESFLSNKKSSKYIQALEDAELLVISKNDLEIFYDQIRKGDRFSRLIIEQIFLKTLQDLNSFYIESPETKYEKFINQNPELIQRLSQYHISSYVGVLPQSLSRIRKRLTKNN